MIKSPLIQKEYLQAAKQAAEESFCNRNKLA
jgi:hypothetical protein